MDERSKVIGFGGRSLNNSSPKYINSPESEYFQKRYLLFNLSNAKISARKKNNLLICEGYMDIISLYEKGIESVVSPLGTALTEQQLNLAWKYSSKPTLMFDGDSAGLRASYKSALMSLNHLSANKFLQFITLPQNLDPDSFVNTKSLDEFVEILKKPISLVNFIFHHASLAYPLNNADDKIIFDTYLESITETIKDKKIKYFYKNEFKSLFFDRIKSKNRKPLSKITYIKSTKDSLFHKQLLSFIATYINHPSIRSEILDELINSKLLDDSLINLLKEISKPNIIKKPANKLLECIKDKNLQKTFKNCLKSDIYQLFPYSSHKFDSEQSLLEINKSCNNLKTRLLNLKKINKSLNSFNENSNQLNWKELQKISKELQDKRL
jgi:DNA primase